MSPLPLPPLRFSILLLPLLALLAPACRSDQEASTHSPPTSPAVTAAEWAPLEGTWGAQAVKHPEWVERLFQSSSGPVWDALLARDPAGAVEAGAPLSEGTIPADSLGKIALGRAHLELGLTFWGAFEVDRTAQKGLYRFRAEAGATVLPSLGQEWFGKVAEGEGPVPPIPSSLVKQGQIQALQAFIHHSSTEGPLPTLAWDQPDWVEILAPATSTTPQVTLAHHDPQRYLALARWHLAQASRWDPTWGALAASLPGASPPGTPSSSEPQRNEKDEEFHDFARTFASHWPRWSDVSEKPEPPLSPLPSLLAFRSELQQAGQGLSSFTGPVTSPQVESLLDRRVALEDALLSSLQTARGGPLSEDDRMYILAVLDSAIRGRGVEVLRSLGNQAPSREPASPGAPASLAVRLLQQALPAEGDPSIFRSPPLARLALARASLEAGSAWRASALVTPLAQGTLTALQPLRETLAALDAAWTGSRTEGPRSD